MFITKRHISRRTVLKGMGVGLSLPLLESMLPAQTPLRDTAAATADAVLRHRNSARRRRQLCARPKDELLVPREGRFRL